MSEVRYLNIKGLEKVFFPLDSSDWHGSGSESVWAKRLKYDRFMIMNIPFYVNDISLDDIIVVQYSEEKLWFKSVIKRGGHSTYRILLLNNINENLFDKYWKALEKNGCTYEKGKTRFYAIDVPPSSDIYKVYQLLEKGEQDSIWEFEEGHCGHTLKKVD